MTEPTRDEVRAWLEERTLIRDASLAQRALALLDEGEKDRAILTRAMTLLGTFRDHAFVPELLENDVEQIDAFLIDQARGV